MISKAVLANAEKELIHLKIQTDQDRLFSYPKFECSYLYNTDWFPRQVIRCVHEECKDENKDLVSVKKKGLKIHEK